MILLDTRVLLWLLAEPDRIGPGVRQLMAQEPQVSFSAVSMVELRIKEMTGRLDPPESLTISLRAAGTTELPLTARHAAGLRAFPELTRHDPFDRLLVAQAWAEQASLVTADRRLLSLDRDWILDART